jgi:hypothetical protein
MQIAFSPTEFWDFDRDSIIWHARVDGRPIRCVLPQQMLTFPFAYPPAEETARMAFRKRRSEVEVKLRERLLHGDFDSPGNEASPPEIVFIT